MDEFKALCHKYPDQKLLIIGDGELRSKIEKSIKQLDLSNNVFLIGHTSNVYYFMKRASAIILSSLWEEVGFVIVEAAVSNLSIISSDCKNGPKEFLSYGEGGLLFNSNKKQALYNSLLLFMNLNEKEILKKKIKAKKNSLKFTMFRHQIQLKNLLN